MASLPGTARRLDKVPASAASSTSVSWFEERERVGCQRRRVEKESCHLRRDGLVAGTKMRGEGMWGDEGGREGQIQDEAGLWKQGRE